MKIGIFDSGIGGLTVLNQLIKNHPNNEYIYFGDTINLPYGTKTKEQLLTFSDKIIKFLLDKKVEIIIIACGTISSNIYNEIKNKYPIPIIDIISPTIEYIKKQNYKKIGLLGTDMTINSNLFPQQLSHHNIEVISQKCPKFVPLIEKNQLETKECNEALKEYLDKFINNDIDTIVLGCTHYPLLQKQIEEYTNIITIDMATCISNLITDNNKKSIELYFSKIDDSLSKNVNIILNKNYDLNLKQL